MAIEWADNFQGYGTGASAQARLTNGVYAEASDNSGEGIALINDPDSNIPTSVLRIRGSSLAGGTTLRRVLLTTRATVGVAQRVWLSRLPNSVNERVILTSFRDVSNNVLTSVVVNTTGALSVWRGGPTSGTLLGSTAGPVLTANAWQHVEIKAVLDSTTGEIEIRVEGANVLSLTGQNTSESDLPCAQVAFNVTISTSTPEYYLKDVVIWNTAGAYNTDFLGSVAVYTLRPDSDVALNWTPSTGSTGWQILDNSPPNDAQYITAGNSPIPSAYRATLTNLPPDVTSVKGLMSVVRARKSDGGDGQLQVGIESGSAVDLGADRPITTAFTYWADVSEENPDTIAPWTPATANSAGLRINRTL